MGASTIFWGWSSAGLSTFAADGLGAASVCTAEFLPVGIVSESTLVALLLRIAAVAYGPSF